MATDHEDFVTALASLSVTGVSKRYELGETPPEQVAPANLPAQWLETSGFRTTCITMDGEYADANRATLVIAVGEIGTSTGIGKLYQTAVTLAKALRAALVSANEAEAISEGGVSWETTIGRYQVGGAQYLAVVTEVQGNAL